MLGSVHLYDARKHLLYNRIYFFTSVPKDDPKVSMRECVSFYIRTRNKSISRLMDKMISNKISQVRRTVISTVSSTVYSLWGREACRI